jgi:two-component system response regulator
MDASPGEILLVEDNRSDLEVILRMLREHNPGAMIHAVRDGSEALDFLFCKGQFAGRSGASLPRVVLLDLKLPLVDGLEVLQQMRADPRTRGIPVVVLSASTRERDVLDSYSLGANSYMVKPLDSARFEEAMRVAGTYWLRFNLSPGQ